jgi:maltooligosyltrehalose trehalohydrolase
VWAPRAETVEIHFLEPVDRIERLHSTVGGYHAGVLSGVEPGTLYYYRLDGGKVRPDPASRFQPHGVHKPSQVVDPDFSWTDQNWYGLPLSD